MNTLSYICILIVFVVYSQEFELFHAQKKIELVKNEEPTKELVFVDVQTPDYASDKTPAYLTTNSNQLYPETKVNAPQVTTTEKVQVAMTPAPITKTKESSIWKQSKFFHGTTLSARENAVALRLSKVCQVLINAEKRSNNKRRSSLKERRKRYITHATGGNASLPNSTEEEDPTQRKSAGNKHSKSDGDDSSSWITSDANILRRVMYYLNGYIELGIINDDEYDYGDPDGKKSQESAFLVEMKGPKLKNNRTIIVVIGSNTTKPENKTAAAPADRSESKMPVAAKMEEAADIS